jgi:hypothetical protein
LLLLLLEEVELRLEPEPELDPLLRLEPPELLRLGVDELRPELDELRLLEL